MINSSTIEQSINDYILSEFLPGENPSNLTGSTPLVTTGILDSIAVLKLVVYLESTFSLSLTAQETDAEHLNTIDLIADLVRSKM